MKHKFYKTKFRDKNGKMIRTGDVCRAFDKTGKEWIGRIVYETENVINNDGLKYTYVFLSNYGTWLHKEYAKKLEIINR